ncbi:MAG: hypothetical protein AB7T37_04145 [Dehalococcoidia bacterium]
MESPTQGLVPEEVQRSVRALFEGGDIIEIRQLGVRLPGRSSTVTLSGYFDNSDDLIRAVSEHAGVASGTYITLNPVREGLLARRANRMDVASRGETTVDADILRRRWLLIDIDPVRPAGISATDVEKAAGQERSQAIVAWLRDRGWDEPVVADSGNGVHLLYRLSEDITTELVRDALVALSLQFDDEQAVVDRTVFNASRIARLYGTMARKGENLPERPHRPSRIVRVPSDEALVTREQLEALAALAPKPGTAADKGVDIERALRDAGMEFTGPRRWNSADLWELEECPWNPEHLRTARVGRFDSGAVFAGCFHNSCAGKIWKDLRPLLNIEEAQGRAGGSQASLLLQIVRDAGVELWHDAAGTAYATIPRLGHHNVRGTAVSGWVRHQYYEATSRVPSALAVRETLELLHAEALWKGPEHTAFLRTARIGSTIYIDLGDSEWQTVTVSGAGWSLEAEVPVRFVRGSGARWLPAPVGDGQGTEIDAIRKLRALVNVESDDDFVLLLAYVTYCLGGRGPYPLLVLNGEQGSAKSTLARMVVRLVDPNKLELLDPPTSLEQLIITAVHRHLLAFDNLSGARPWLSDALCRLSTGGGLAKRELYTDAGLVVFDALRPVVLNGIDDLTARGDLADRTVLITLPAIETESRRTEADLWAEFEAIAPAVFAELLGLTAGALRELPQVALAETPRMADFAFWGSAVERAAGWPVDTFAGAYGESRVRAEAAVIDSQPVIDATVKLMDSLKMPVHVVGKVSATEWSGRASELLNVLNAGLQDRPPSWPRQPSRLSNLLRRAAPVLRSLGIEVEMGERVGKHRVRVITIRKVAVDGGR